MNAKAKATKATDAQRKADQRDRKAAQRARDREQGLTDFVVKIPDNAEAREMVRRYCEKMVKKHTIKAE